jgi:signal peptidase I
MPSSVDRPLRALASVFVAAAVALVARSSFADHYVVPTGSMLPTVQLQDHVLVDKMAYGLRLPLLPGYLLRFDGPALGDVVVLTAPDNGSVLLKRVVAVPGDTVEVRAGQLRIDGRAVPVEARHGASTEALGDRPPHPVSLDDGGGPDFGPTPLRTDRYLVMGDNRGNSRDGRYFGLVERNEILGRAWGVLVRGGRFTWVGL